MSHWGSIIEAVKDPFGVAALVVLVLFILALRFFPVSSGPGGRDTTNLRLGVFIVLVIVFVGLVVLAFGGIDPPAGEGFLDRVAGKWKRTDLNHTYYFTRSSFRVIPSPNEDYAFAVDETREACTSSSCVITYSTDDGICFVRAELTSDDAMIWQSLTDPPCDSREFTRSY